MKKIVNQINQNTNTDILTAIEDTQVNIVYEIARLEIEHKKQIEFLKQQSKDLNELRTLIVNQIGE